MTPARTPASDERAGRRRPAPAAGAGGWVARARRLEVRPRPTGPHVRLGVLWFVVSMAALLAGRLALALVLAPAAGAAALQAGRTWRGRRRPAAPLAGAGAAALVLAAAAGPVAVAGAAAVLVAVVVGGSALAGAGRRADPVVTLVIAATVGLAAASPVLLLQRGLVPAFVLMSFVHVHDAASYVVGTGANGAWEGTAAGGASIAAVTLAVAAVLVPPFRGASPWVLGALAVLLAPAGPYVGSALLGDRRARVPALRRLDTLLALGPLWSLAAAALLE